MGLLSALTRSRLSTLSGARRAAQRGMVADEPVTRLPVNPSREIGPGGLPMAAPQPFRQSLVGGSDDLTEAARMIRPEDWPLFQALIASGVSAGAAIEMLGAGAQKAPLGAGPGGA